MSDTTEHHGSSSLNAPSPSNSQSNDLLNLLDSLYPKGSLGEQRFHEALKNQEELKNILIEIEKLPQEKRYELLMQIGQAKQRIMEAYAHSFLGYTRRTRASVRIMYGWDICFVCNLFCIFKN